MARTTIEHLASEGVDVSAVADPSDPYWQELYLKMLKADLCFFAKEVLQLEIGPHMLAWGDIADSSQRACILAARDHSKSTFWSYAFPIWRAWAEPGCEVYIFSKTLEQAQEFLEIIVFGRANLKGIVDIPSLAHLVPNPENFRGSKDPRARFTRSDVKLLNGSRIRVAGYGKAMRGRHPKYVVCDDVLNDEDMHSETVRKKNISYFQSAISHMPPPDGQLVVVGTPYHINDLYGWIRQNPSYKFIRFPGILDFGKPTERALFPWRWNLEQLKGKRQEVGSVAFAREILVEPVTDDISIFPSFLFPPLFDTTLTLKPSKETIRQNGWSVFFGVDIARSASVGADYFVIFVQAKDSDGSRIILDIDASRGLPFRKQLDRIQMLAARYQPDMIFIEANAMQQVYSDELIRTTDLPIKPFVTTAINKYPLDKGVPGLRLLLENQKVVIPRGDEYSRQITDEWITECTQFGFIDGKLQGIGEHDDRVLAWWFAEEATKAGGFSFAMGDEDGDGDEDDLDSDGDWESYMTGGEEEAEDAFGT